MHPSQHNARQRPADAHVVARPINEAVVDRSRLAALQARILAHRFGLPAATAALVASLALPNS